MKSPLLLGLVLSAASLGVVACRTTSSTVAPSEAAATTATAAQKVATGRRAYTKPSADAIRAKLTPLQYEVTQHEATEPAFHNEYWDNHEAGIYVDVVTGAPLFSSADKFDSGTGWPSFSRPIDDAAVATDTDVTFGMVRTAVRSSSGDSHLGHVFDDGPGPTHLRYCINSASLRFVPASRLEAEGYGAYRAPLAGGASDALPVDTNNSCAVPPPGERPGCSATLDTAILGADAGVAKTLAGVPGVLEVDRGAVGAMGAARVVFDPKTLTFTQLLDAWSKAAGPRAAKVLAITAEQKSAADTWKMHASARVAVESGDEAAFVASSR